MTRHGIFHRQRLSGLFVLLIFLLLTLLPSGCGEENRSSSSETVTVSDTETASTALTIRWHGAQQDSALIRAAALDCEASGVGTVVCDVYDASGNRLVTGPSWPCANSTGRIDGIPVGPDRTFVVLAEDANGNVRFQGQTSGITINAGEITEGVVVDAYLFIPTLTAPDNGAQQVDPNTLSFEWALVENADEYLVQVAEDIDFQSIIIDETTPALSYAPTTLATSTQYFWKISAVDPHGNIGAASAARSFVTSDCAYTILPESSSIADSGGTGSISVSAASGCTWSASEDADWIQITSGTSGDGDGTVSYTVSANSGAARSARITIAGQPHTVNQDPTGCTFTIAPTSRTVAAAGGAYDVTVTATHDGCDWTASENQNYTWISLSPTDGSGGGSVRITVDANTGAARQARITIAGRTHTVDQDPAGCTFTIAPTSRTVAAAGDAYDVSVTATHGGCDWTASENQNYTWISLSPTSGSGDGTVRITVDANTGAARPARITIAGQTHTVNQDPGASPPTPDPMTWARVPYETGTSSIAMVATTASDPQTPITYRFDFVSSPTGGTGGTDSNWQSSTSYSDTGLGVNQRYGYRVQARDADNNSTAWSSTEYRYTNANPPAYAQFSNQTMTSIQANWIANGNPSGTEYYCENMTAGTNSGWITATSWNSANLTCGTRYQFRVKARNGNNVETTWTALDDTSTAACSSIVGTWQESIDINCTGEAGINTLIFHADNTFDSDPRCSNFTGTWGLKGNTITFTYTGCDYLVYTGTVNSARTQMSGTMGDQGEHCWSAIKN